MWGLWIIVASAFGASLLLSLFMCHVRRQKHHGGPLLALFTQDELLLYGSHEETESSVFRREQSLIRVSRVSQQSLAAVKFMRGRNRTKMSEMASTSNDKEVLAALSQFAKSLDSVVDNVNSLYRSIHGSDLNGKDPKQD